MHQSELDQSRSRRVTPISGSSDTRKIRFIGLVNRTERWGLSWKGWLLFFLVVVGLAAAAFYSVYPFLAVTQRANTDTLVVEGWIPEYAIRVAVHEFRAGHYQQVFSTGGPVEGMGGYTNDYNTAASVGAELLKRNGVPTESLQMVPSRVMDRNRTYSSAVALRNWFRDHNLVVRGINVVTEDVHARRTRLLFQEALGSGTHVGVIAVPNSDYNVRHWWRYSEGVKEVVSESVAYLYAKFFFWPSAAEPQRKIEDRR
jgi:uncharacterized SAM-binding protein YcdF (DUF218 family)